MALSLSALRGAEPRVGDGVRGEALSVTAAAGPETTRDMGAQAGYSTSGTYRWWTGATQLIVSAPGMQPVFVNSYRRMTREKYLIPGLRVPVTVSRNRPTRFRIEWDEVPAIDELIGRGDVLFTDPDATRPAIRAAFAAAGLESPMAGSRRELDGPSARVVSFGGAGTAPSPFTSARRVDLLLSVAIPGEPRFGHRWLGKAPRKLILRPGTNIPVLYDPARPREIDIPWDDIGTTRQRSETVRAQLSYGTMLQRVMETGIEMPAEIRAFTAGAPLPMASARSVRLELEVQPPDREPYAASFDQLLPDAIAATLAAGQRVTVKVAGDDPQTLMLWNTPHAAGGADPDTGRPR